MPVTLRLPEKVQTLADTFNPYGISTMVAVEGEGCYVAALDQPAFFRRKDDLAPGEEIEQRSHLCAFGSTPAAAIKNMIKEFRARTAAGECLVARRGDLAHREDNYFNYVVLEAGGDKTPVRETGKIKAFKGPKTPETPEFQSGIIHTFEPCP